MSPHSTELPKFDLFGHAFKANPYATYQVMQQEAPVYGRASGHGGSTTWFVTRYEDAVAVLRDDKRFVKDPRNALSPAQQNTLPEAPRLLRLLTNHMLNLDEPDHTRLRALVNRAFTAPMVDRLQNRVQAIADQLVDQVAASSHMDLIDDFAFPLPITVIAELLGIPPEDRSRFRRWTRVLFAPSPDEARNRRKLAKYGGLMEDFIGYLQQVMAERSRAPRDDLITSLLLAEEAGDRLSQEELFSMILFLVVVGHETTVNLIGNGMLALLTHPRQLEQLRLDPGLIPAAVEEMLRYDCPVERAPLRFAAEDTELNGMTICRGDSVSVVLGAANRDPDQFEAPHEFRIRRPAHRHLAFGLGAHYCLGAPLARLEGRIAVETLIGRLPGLRLAIPPTDLRWRTNPILRGALHMPVTW